MSFWGGLLKALPVVGSAFGSIAQGQAQNRASKLEGQMDLDRLLSEREDQLQRMQIGREQENRAGTSDAWRKLLSTQHALEPGARPQLSPYSIAPRQPNLAEQVGANYLGGESLRRLQGGNPIPQVTQHPLVVDPKLLNPGWMERLFGYAAPAATAAGQMWKK